MRLGALTLYRAGSLTTGAATAAFRRPPRAIHEEEKDVLRTDDSRRKWMERVFTKKFSRSV